MKIEIKPRSLFKPLIVGHVVAFALWWVIVVAISASTGKLEFGEEVSIGLGITFYPQDGIVPMWAYSFVGRIISAVLTATFAWICTILGLWSLHNLFGVKVVGTKSADKLRISTDSEAVGD